MKRMIILACALGMACGDDDGTDPDSGMDGGADVGMTDTGTDTAADTGADVTADTTPPACEVGCEIVELTMGSAFCGRRENGEVLCWGANRFGQLGDDTRAHEDCTDLGMTEREDCSSEPVVVLDVVATQITNNGGPNTCALQADDSILCWGLGDIPPPGTDSRPREFIPVPLEGFTSPSTVETRNSNTCVITGTTGVECYGTNDSGQVGNGMFIEQATPAAVTGLANIVELDVGFGETSCARASDGVFCWGNNRSGQLGDDSLDHGEVCGEAPSTFDCSSAPVQVAILTGGTPTREAVQMDVGGEHACAVTSEGELWCWGNNDGGQLGTGNNDGTTLPVQVPGITTAEEVACGFAHTCVRLSDGAVQCWGLNHEGQIGDSADVGTHDRCEILGGSEDCTVSPSAVALPGAAIQIATSFSNSCALLDNNQVWCWGENDRRQLGTSDSRERSSAPVQILGFE